MGAVAVGAVLLAVVLVIVAGFMWQAARKSPVTDHAEYFVHEAAAYVYDRLSDRALHSLGPDDVLRILEWNLHFTQVEAPRALGHPAVIGGGDGIEYVMHRAAAAGDSIEPLDIAEVMAIETDYLVTIGAVGAPVEDEPA